MSREGFEARLDALREEAVREGEVEGAGVRAAGGPLPAAATPAGYRGQPILKPPVWTWEVPVYFFVGGLAGMAAVLAFAAMVSGESVELVRAALWLGTAGAAVSPVFLILDLGRPMRFYNMLRVFKPRSAMSVGTWVLSGFGLAVTIAALLVTWPQILTSLGLGDGAITVLTWLATAAAALFGMTVATYTGVLLGATAVPAWHLHHRVLPIHFGGMALGSAAAALELLGFRLEPLNVLGFAAAIVESLLALRLELRRHGAADRALRHGRSGLLVRAGGVAVLISLAARLAGWVPLAATVFLLGALISRFGWVAAGRASAADPEAVLDADTVTK